MKKRWQAPVNVNRFYWFLQGSTEFCQLRSGSIPHLQARTIASECELTTVLYSTSASGGHSHTAIGSKS